MRTWNVDDEIRVESHKGVVSIWPLGMHVRLGSRLAAALASALQEAALHAAGEAAELAKAAASGGEAG